MRKKFIYIIGLLALGIVIFNNYVQTIQSISNNKDYLIGLMIALIVSIIYGIINIKN